MAAVKAVVFDWAGTLIDHGSRAPAGVFVEAFRAFDVEISFAEARAPMGLPKRAHIAALMARPRIAAAWAAAQGRAPGETEIDAVYAAFLPMTEAVVAAHAAPIPGAPETLAWLRKRGIGVGSTTGYARSILNRALPIAARGGVAPDVVVCADDLAEGRPGPLMMYQNFVELAVYPPRAVLKVDDTAPGIAEGRAAGCPTVGVTLSGNAAGLSVEELAAAPAAERDALRSRAAEALRAAGADHVIDSVAELPALIERLERRAA